MVAPSKPSVLRRSSKSLADLTKNARLSSLLLFANPKVQVEPSYPASHQDAEQPSFVDLFHEALTWVRTLDVLQIGSPKMRTRFCGREL